MYTINAVSSVPSPPEKKNACQFPEQGRISRIKASTIVQKEDKNRFQLTPSMTLKRMSQAIQFCKFQTNGPVNGVKSLPLMSSMTEHEVHALLLTKIFTSSWDQYIDQGSTAGRL